jgi:hypothetical protein
LLLLLLFFAFFEGDPSTVPPLVTRAHFSFPLLLHDDDEDLLTTAFWADLREEPVGNTTRVPVVPGMEVTDDCCRGFLTATGFLVLLLLPCPAAATFGFGNCWGSSDESRPDMFVADSPDIECGTAKAELVELAESFYKIYFLQKFGHFLYNLIRHQLSML